MGGSDGELTSSEVRGGVDVRASLPSACRLLSMLGSTKASIEDFRSEELALPLSTGSEVIGMVDHGVRAASTAEGSKSRDEVIPDTDTEEMGTRATGVGLIPRTGSGMGVSDNRVGLSPEIGSGVKSDDVTGFTAIETLLDERVLLAEGGMLEGRGLLAMDRGALLEETVLLAEGGEGRGLLVVNRGALLEETVLLAEEGEGIGLLVVNRGALLEETVLLAEGGALEGIDLLALEEIVLLAEGGTLLEVRGLLVVDSEGGVLKRSDSDTAGIGREALERCGSLTKELGTLE